jgi:hypothetical protein
MIEIAALGSNLVGHGNGPALPGQRRCMARDGMLRQGETITFTN